MKLSDAIREGAKRRPQARFCCFQTDTEGNVIGSCAIGAAVEATIGIVYKPIDKARQLFPELQEYRKIEFNSHVYSTLEDLIFDSNDFHDISREDIANVVERLGY